MNINILSFCMLLGMSSLLQGMQQQLGPELLDVQNNQVSVYPYENAKLRGAFRFKKNGPVYTFGESKQDGSTEHTAYLHRNGQLAGVFAKKITNPETNQQTVIVHSNDIKLGMSRFIKQHDFAGLPIFTQFKLHGTSCQRVQQPADIEWTKKVAHPRAPFVGAVYFKQPTWLGFAKQTSRFAAYHHVHEGCPKNWGCSADSTIQLEQGPVELKKAKIAAAFTLLGVAAVGARYAFGLWKSVQKPA